MQVQIKFLVSGANSVYGGFSAGDTLRCPEAVAAHFVDLGLAKIVEQQEPKPEPKKRKQKQ